MEMETNRGNTYQSSKTTQVVIMKFNRTYADWPRYWGQYSESIDKSGVPPVTKFVYQRELLDAKVRKMIEAKKVKL